MSHTEKEVQDALDAIPVLSQLEISRLLAMEYIVKAQDEMHSAIKETMVDKEYPTAARFGAVLDSLKACVRILNDTETEDL